MTILCLECAKAHGVNALWLKLQEPKVDLCELCGEGAECIEHPGSLAGYTEDDIDDEEAVINEMQTGES
jgi:hypothetical protein